MAVAVFHVTGQRGVGLLLAREDAQLLGRLWNDVLNVVIKRISSNA